MTLHRFQATYVVIVSLLAILCCLVWKGISEGRWFDRPKTGQVMVVRNYNPQGGFFWQLYNVLLASHHARKKGLELLIVMDSGLYVESDISRLPAYVPTTNVQDWFTYYFSHRDEALYQRFMLEQPRLTSFAHYRTEDARKVLWYEWDRAALSANHFRNIDEKREWEAHMGSQLLPYVTDQVHDLWTTQHQLDDCYVIGAHYRGTDKLPNKDSSEDGPVHLEYRWFTEQLTKQHQLALRMTNKPIRVFIATDEKPLLTYLHNHFTACPFRYNDCIRSHFSTDGLRLQSHLCDQDPPAVFKGTEHPDCVTYWRMREHSVHIGHRDKSEFKKGLDILTDVLMLAKCDVLLKSQGNVSNFPYFINPDLKVIHMTQLYHAEEQQHERHVMLHHHSS